MGPEGLTGPAPARHWPQIPRSAARWDSSAPKRERYSRWTSGGNWAQGGRAPEKGQAEELDGQGSGLQVQDQVLEFPVPVHGMTHKYHLMLRERQLAAPYLY